MADARAFLNIAGSCDKNAAEIDGIVQMVEHVEADMLAEVIAQKESSDVKMGVAIRRLELSAEALAKSAKRLRQIIQRAQHKAGNSDAKSP